jgi:acid phosphatase (class A)
MQALGFPNLRLRLVLFNVLTSPRAKADLNEKMMRPTVPLLVLAVSTLVSPALAIPEQVILLRHADKDTGRGDYNLSPKGFERSIRLGQAIPSCFGAPTRIGVYDLDPATSKNARSYQTAVPLAVATGVNIALMAGSQTNSLAVGQQVLRAKSFDGARAVFIWEHRKLPDLAKGLGWGAMEPIGPDDYDQMIVFSWPSAGAHPQVKLLSQKELFQRPCSQNPQTESGVASIEAPGVGLQLDLPSLRATTGQPPQPGEVKAVADVAILEWLQRYRSPQLIANSWLLLDRNLTNFDLALGVDMAKITPQLLRGLSPYLALVDGAKDSIKETIRRPRPYLADPRIHPCLPKESGWSFPSGHSAFYRAAAELLADLVPERRERLLAVGLTGGTSRTLCGVHYPSDVEAGQRLGEAAAQQIIASDQWRRFKLLPGIQAELQKIQAVKQQLLPLAIN